MKEALFQIKNRSTILPGKFKEFDARKLADQLSRTEVDGWIYFIVQAKQ